MNNRFKTLSNDVKKTENNIFKSSRSANKPPGNSRFNFIETDNSNNSSSNSRKYVPPGGRRPPPNNSRQRQRNRGGNPRENSHRRRSPSVNTFNWEKKKKEAEEKARREKMALTEDNFPSLSTTEKKAPTTTRQINDAQTEGQTEAQTEHQTGIRAITNTAMTQNILKGYKDAIKKKKEQKKVDIRVDPGWVTMRLVNGRVVKYEGKTKASRRRPLNTTAALNRMHRAMEKTRLEGWERDGFWDYRLDQLEKIIAEAERTDSESSCDEEEYEEDDDDYYDGGGGGGGGGKRWWTS